MYVSMHGIHVLRIGTRCCGAFYRFAGGATVVRPLAESRNQRNRYNYANDHAEIRWYVRESAESADYCTVAESIEKQQISKSAESHQNQQNRHKVVNEMLSC